MRWKLIRTYLVGGVQLPKIRKRDAASLDTARSARSSMRPPRGIYEFVMLAVSAGCRRGELLALTWADVDFVGRIPGVSKSMERLSMLS
jgi:integrase